MLGENFALKTAMEECCGCGACVAICPVHSIVMRENDEGFPEPFSSDVKCINCGCCNEVCPVQKNRQDNAKKQWGYIGQNTNTSVRLESTSGGVFSAIGQYVLDEGGIVYGATFDNSMSVRHAGVETIKELHKFRNSKYIQSRINSDVYTQIRKFLSMGRMVCFSGTPCQIEGLVSFLKKDYENLILVDVICRAVASPMIWKKYLEFHSNTEFNYAYFRKKHYGYKYSSMSLMNDREEVYYNGVETDPMLRAYFDNICDRQSCYNCKFKQRYRNADLTLSDCYDVRKWSKTFDDDQGSTKICVHSCRGNFIIEELVRKDYLRVIEVDVDDLLSGIYEMKYSVKQKPSRLDFFRDANLYDGSTLFEKWYPITFTVKIKKLTRIMLLKLGLYQFIRRLWWKFSWRRR